MSGLTGTLALIAAVLVFLVAAIGVLAPATTESFVCSIGAVVRVADDGRCRGGQTLADPGVQPPRQSEGTADWQGRLGVHMRRLREYWRSVRPDLAPSGVQVYTDAPEDLAKGTPASVEACRQDGDCRPKLEMWVRGRGNRDRDFARALFGMAHVFARLQFARGDAPLTDMVAERPEELLYADCLAGGYMRWARAQEDLLSEQSFELMKEEIRLLPGGERRLGRFLDGFAAGADVPPEDACRQFDT